MTIRVLAIGDLANNVTTMKKFVKSRIHLVNFPWNTASKIMDEKDDIEFFDSINVINNIKKINKIKNEFDICLALSPAGARIAYLCDLNYIILFDYLSRYVFKQKTASQSGFLYLWRFFLLPYL